MEIANYSDANDDLLRDLTEDIIKAYFKVYNTLGYGFLEQVYQNAMYKELKKKHDVKPQYDINVYYEGVIVGKYRADIIVDDLVILELKAANELCEANALQLQNYLKATHIEVGLLLNFGRNPEIRRKIFRNENK